MASFSDWREVDWSPFLEAPGRAGLLSDFDGTLSAVVTEPAQARLLPGAADALGRLAARWGLVGVVSGRPTCFLSQALPQGHGLVIAGIYGLEVERDGRVSVRPDALHWQPVVAEVVARARQECPTGVYVEDKRISVALHSRQAPGTFDWAQAWAAEQADRTGLRTQQGRLAVELVPPVAMDKGAVVAELAGDMGAVCFIGDDKGDLPAFEALRRLRQAGAATVAIGIASDEQPPGLTEMVDVLLERADQAVELLRYLAA